MPTPIAFIDHATAFGGAENSLFLLLKHLDREQWKPHLVVQKGALKDRATTLGIPVYPISLPRLRSSAPITLWSQAWKLSRILKSVHARCLIANTTRSVFYGVLAAKLARIPFIWYRRDFWLGEAQPRHLWLDHLLKWILCQFTTVIIANSYATARRLPCSNKITVIHNGIEVERFNSQLDGKDFRTTHNIPLDAFVIGTVGRLRPWKGQDCFLRVLAQVRESIPNVYGVIVGGTPFGGGEAYTQSLRTLAKDLGVEDHVIFTGQMPEPQQAVASFDVFVHPGSPEPFGLVNVEAMAMVKPVVAFSHGALPEIVVDGETGLLIEPDNELAMAVAITDLLRMPSTIQAMGQASLEHVQTHFSIQQTVTNLNLLLVNYLDTSASQKKV